MVDSAICPSQNCIDKNIPSAKLDTWSRFAEGIGYKHQSGRNEKSPIPCFVKLSL